MTTSTKEKSNQEFKPVEEVKPKKKKKTKLSQIEKFKAFEMYYESDFENKTLIKILNEIAEEFNITYDKAFKLYSNENWLMEADKRDLAVAMEYERNNIKRNAEIKKKYNDFICDEFDKLVTKYECEKESYFKTPDQLAKFMKITLEMNSIDMESIIKGLYKTSDDGKYDYHLEITKKRMFERKNKNKKS